MGGSDDAFKLSGETHGAFPHLMARDTELAVRLMLDAIGDALAEGSRVEVRGFGSFALSYRPPRVGRNPKSGDQVVVPAKHVPHFKAGKELRERVDQLGLDAGMGTKPSA